MPTVIDSLIVTLGLDPKNFNDGQKKTSESWLKTVGAFQKGGKTVEESSKKAAETVNLITRRVLELFAVLTGSRALTDFAAKLISTDAALGRFASSLGETPQRVAEWEMAAERFGGSNEATAATLERVNKQLYDLNKNGIITPELYKLQAWTGMTVDTGHGLDKYLSDVSAALQKLHNTDPATAHIVAQALGIDPATEQLMYEQGKNIDALLSKYKDRAPSDAAIAASARLQASWVDLQQQATSLGNTILTAVGPAIADAIKRMTDWIDKNQEWIKAGIADAVNKFIDAVGKIPWADIGKGIQNFATGANEVATALGGWQTVTEALFALWVGAKFLAVLANVRLLAGLVGLGGGGAAAGGAASAAAGVGSRLLAGATGLFGMLVEGMGSTPGETFDEQVANQRKARLGLSGALGLGGKSGKEKDDTVVGGQPVSKSNPLPVTVTDQSSGSGGGFWSNLVSGIGKAFGGGGSTGGAAGNAGAAVGGMVGGASSVPNISGMTDSERTQLGLIMKYKSGGKNVMNYEGQAQHLDASAAKGYTAQGYYQILNSNWRRLAPKLGITAKNAMAASEEDQTKVALALLRESGVGNWSRYNPALRGALARAGGNAGSNPVATGAKSAALSTMSATHGATTSSTSVENHIGKIDVVSQATDADGVAGDINGALNRRLFSAQANYGLA